MMEQQEMFSKAEKIKGLKDYIQSQEEEYQRLLDTYGTGVRPSWVSADLANIGMNIQYSKEQISELEGDQ